MSLPVSVYLHECGKDGQHLNIRREQASAMLDEMQALQERLMHVEASMTTPEKQRFQVHFVFSSHYLVEYVQIMEAWPGANIQLTLLQWSRCSI
jgi:hypothetical protein